MSSATTNDIFFMPYAISNDVYRWRDPGQNSYFDDRYWNRGYKEDLHDGSGSGNGRVGLRDRLEHFTWPWFISTMSTGGVAIVLVETSHRFRGLYTIGVVVFIFNLVVFTTLCLLMATRFFLGPRRFLKSFVHPTEMFFFGSFLLSIATIIGCIQVYAIRGTHTHGPAWPWLIDCIHILYWIYCAFALPECILQYWLYMQRSPTRPIPITAGWFLPGYSVMLTGTIAALVAETQPPSRRMPIIISCVAYQGFGWIFSFTFIIIYIARLLESGLPPPDQRPGMFILVAAPAYTMTALMGISRTLPRNYGYFATHPSAADSLQSVALFVSVFLWLFAFWLFCIALISCVVAVPEMGFTLPWWAMIFPNVGFTLATIDIGVELESEGIMWVASVMTVLLVAVWLFIWGACIYAVIKKRILWPGKDEDKDM